MKPINRFFIPTRRNDLLREIFLFLDLDFSPLIAVVFINGYHLLELSFFQLQCLHRHFATQQTRN